MAKKGDYTLHPAVSSHLERQKLSFTERRHADYKVPIKSPDDFARALGYPIERITKSLFLTANSGARAIALCSINKKVQFGVIAKALDSSRLQIASKDELKDILGYPPTGVSPFGVPCPIFVDSGIMSFETILVGGGEVGVEIELPPDRLVQATSAQILDFAIS